MNVVQNITVKQMKVLLIFFIVGDIMWYLPSLTTSMAEQDAWISVTVGLCIGVGIASLIYWFGKQFPGKTIVDIHRQVLGRFIGGIFSLLFLVHIFAKGGAQVRIVSDFMTTQMNPETPMQIVLLLFGLITLIAVRTGFPVIARTGQVFFAIFIFLFVLLVILLFSEMDPSRLLPVFSHSAADIARGALYEIAFPFCQLTVFLMLFPLIEKDKAMYRSFLSAVIIGGIMSMILIVLSILVLGSYMTEHQIYSTYAMAKKINIGNFLQRFEAILVICYLLSTYIKCVITIYALCHGLKILFGLKDHRVLTFPILLLLFGFSYFISSNVVFSSSLAPVWALWEVTELLVLMIIVYGVHWIKQRFSKQKGQGQKQKQEQAEG